MDVQNVMGVEGACMVVVAGWVLLYLHYGLRVMSRNQFVRW